MSITALPARAAIATNNRIALLGREAGQATSEYGTVILCAIALGLAVLAVITGGTLDASLTAMLKKVLTTATGVLEFKK